jgi:glycosyltransferase involved in cell wall biosynthesis
MVTPCFFPVVGGTETVVRNLSISLNKANILTDVLTFNMNQNRVPSWQGKTERMDDFSVFKIPALNVLGVLRSYKFTMGVNLLPSKFTSIMKDYDIIHFHESDLSFPFFSYLVKKPKILHFHGIDVQFLRRYHLSRMLMKQLADYYVSISRKMVEELLSLGIGRERIMYLPNGVDTNLFKPAKRKEENLILFVGRVNARKGVKILVRALQYLETPAKLVIIGPMDETFKPEIMTLITDMNQKGKHKIEYLGAMSNTDAIKWYQQSSLFVLPSFAEGFPMTILEALSCETPVIATCVGGIPEIVKDNTTGILIQPDNPVALAQVVQNLLENRQAIIRLGREGRKQVVQHYSLEASVKKLCALYRQLI